MNFPGFVFALKRLFNAPHQEAMRSVFTSLGDEYRTDANLLWFKAELEKLKPKDGKRSLSQNALLHQWFGEIAKHYGDRTAKQVKGQCHHEYGLDIRLRDKAFAWVWERTGALLDYEKQCALLASETLGMSSQMSKPELSEYMSAMQRDYAEKGVRLTIPEEAR